MKTTKRSIKIKEILAKHIPAKMANVALAVESAVDILKECSTARTNASGFDESFDIAVKIGIDPTKQDQNIRAYIDIPNSAKGKQAKIAVFTSATKAPEALSLGADQVGLDDIIGGITKRNITFDYAIASPDVMSSLGKVAKILGPRALMPNAKLGTITNDFKTIINRIRNGIVEIRNDKTALIHASIGKLSNSREELIENYQSFMRSLSQLRPENAKGDFIRQIHITSTQGPSLAIRVK